MSAIAETQVTVYRALSQADLPTVHIDEPSETASSPYIVVGETTMNDEGTKNRDGENFTITLHVWDESSSYNAKQIISDVSAVLKGGLTIGGGFSLWLSTVEYADVIQDPSGWRHGVVRLRLRIQE